MMRRKQIHAVITPAAFSGKFIDRHQFHMGHTEVHEMIKFLDCRLEGACRRKSPDVQLINYRGRQRLRPPTGISPVEGVMINRAGKPMNTLRLPCRTWIRKRPFTIKHEAVVVAMLT